MTSKTQTNVHSRHIDSFGELSDATLQEWYRLYQPVGSGPLGSMRHICILIETIAKERNIELPPAKGIQKVKRTRSKPDVNTMGWLEVAVRKAVGEQTGLDPFSIHPTKTWYDQGLDSLDHVEIIMHLEDEFEIEITDSQAENLQSLRLCIEFVGEHSKKKRF